MTRRKRNIIGIVLAVLILLGGFIGWFGYQVIQIPTNAYAVWWTADLVIEHMEKHAGAWPRSWEEMQATSDQAYKGTTSTNRDGTWVAEFRPRASIEELQQRVVIDWSANPKELAKANFKTNGPPFRVIWLRNGKSTHYSGKEPNGMVLEYLKWKDKSVGKPEPIRIDAVKSGWNGQLGSSRRQLAAALRQGDCSNQMGSAGRTQSGGRVARHNGPVARSTKLLTAWSGLR
jgi:hypothetical protein